MATKLGIKPGHAVLLIGAPERWTVPHLPAGVDAPRLERSAEPGSIGEADIVLVFCRSAAVLHEAREPLSAALRPGAAAWTVWPRKAAGHVSDVTENLLREVLLPTGLVDTKVAALDEDWSGLRFVWRKALRPK